MSQVEALRGPTRIVCGLNALRIVRSTRAVVPEDVGKSAVFGEVAPGRSGDVVEGSACHRRHPVKHVGEHPRFDARVSHFEGLDRVVIDKLGVVCEDDIADKVDGHVSTNPESETPVVGPEKVPSEKVPSVGGCCWIQASTLLPNPPN